MSTTSVGSSKSAFQTIRSFLELVRFSHTVFALPFALVGCIWALAVPMDERISLATPTIALRVAGILCCMIFARSAAMAFNRLVDARIDALNPRTARRHIPSGQLSAASVTVFFCVMAVGFIASCLLFLPNWIPIVGSIPVLAWICGYSFAKRFTSAAHLWLGVALAMTPVCAWLAMRGEQVVLQPFDVLPALALAVAIALWVAGFDIIYACQDAEFDQRSGLHSIPARFGVAGALRIAAFLHGMMLVALTPLPWTFPQLHLGWLYLSALGVVTILVLIQHNLVRPNDLARVNVAFFNVNAIISLGFSLAAGIDPWL